MTGLAAAPQEFTPLLMQLEIALQSREESRRDSQKVSASWIQVQPEFDKHDSAPASAPWRVPKELALFRSEFLASAGSFLPAPAKKRAYPAAATGS
jgi:hypothetical protein